MDVTTMKRHGLEARVREWSASAINAVTLRNPQSIHLDELLEDYDRAAAEALLFDAFEYLTRNIQPQAASLAPIGLLPLLPSQQLDTSVPTRPFELDAAEPPAIYVIERDALKLLDVTEAYCCPLNLNLSTPKEVSGYVYAYYRCSRDAESIARGWEYSRGVYLIHYPTSLLTGVETP
jgi:hypothetical protein